MANTFVGLTSAHKRPRSRSLYDAAEQPSRTLRRNSYASLQDCKFQHAPLNLKATSIRLIEVLPLDDTGLVQCNVKHTTTDAQYTCVSYVWGSLQDARLIYINGRAFQVRRNLWDFLYIVSQRARKKVFNHEKSRLSFQEAAESLWIDALCIDQNNNGEKNHQVQQMGMTFSRAQRVIAWVGQRADFASLFRYMREDMREQRFFDADYFFALDEFCSNVYWKRAWITQEIQLAHKVLVLAETEEIDLVVLRDEVQDSVLRTFGPFVHKDLWRRIHHTTIQQKNKSLLENMRRFRTKECSDSLDLVYSLLSISTDGAQIGVEYGISKAQLAHKVLRHTEDELCPWRIARVLQILEITNHSGYQADRTFMNIQACLSEITLPCTVCDTRFSWSVKEEFKTLRTYTHCLVCSHSRLAVSRGMTVRHRLEHLLLTQSRTSGLLKETGELEWRLYRVNGKKCSQLDCGPHIATLDADGIFATIHLTLEVLCELINHTREVKMTSGDNYHDESEQQNGIAHKPNPGWSVAD